MSKLYRNRDWLYDQYWNKEKSQFKIAKDFGFAVSTIQIWIKKLNISIRNKSEGAKLIHKTNDKLYSNEIWLRKQYIDEQKSTTQIAKELNVGIVTINTWIHKFGIKMRTNSESIKIAIEQGRIDIWQKGFAVRTGFIPWNKGIPCSEETKKKISELSKGDKHINWKGDNASSSQKHTWMRNIKLKPKLCENCKQKKKLDLSFDHSKGVHTRNPDDYIYLCRKCHSRRDYGSDFIKNFTLLQKKNLHNIIRSKKKKLEHCQICNEKGKSLEIACIDHIYTMNIKAYIWLCHSCHKKFDICRAFIPKEYKQKLYKHEFIENEVCLRE